MTYEYTHPTTSGVRHHSGRARAVGATLVLLLAVLCLWTAHASAQPASDGYWPVTRRHMFARDSGNNLIMYLESLADPDIWQSENLSARFPTRFIGERLGIAGTPRPVADWNPVRGDVFGRNADGELVHYWWLGGAWHAENLTAGPHAALPRPPLPANPTFISDPDVVVSYQNGYLRHDVFARNSVGQLVHYWNYCAPPCTWHAENLTTGPHAAVSQPPLPANPTFTSALAVYSSYHRSLQVFARNSAGQLIQYSPSLSGWEASNPTLTASGPLIAGNPAVMKSDTDDHRD